MASKMGESARDQSTRHLRDFGERDGSAERKVAAADAAGRRARSTAENRAEPDTPSRAEGTQYADTAKGNAKDTQAKAVTSPGSLLARHPYLAASAAVLLIIGIVAAV